MDDAPPTVPERLSVEEVFKDYKARRTALIKALTTDVEDLYQKCDPGKENLCLYGHQNGNWELSTPPDMVPGELPEPALGINFERDLIEPSDWVALVARHSDAWLYSVSFCISGTYGFSKTDRKSLFDMINELPTISEVVRGTAKKQPEESSKSRRKKTKSESKGKQPKVSRLKCEENEEAQDDDTKCGQCKEVYIPGEFWIACDFCGEWFHGSCVKITPQMAEGIEKYECPICNNTK